ncbi:hypothetical protein ABID95_001485 [Streptomyces atratus]
MADRPARPFRSESGDPDVVGYSLQGELRHDRHSETTGHHREHRSVVLCLHRRRRASGLPRAPVRPWPRNPRLSVGPYFREEMDGGRELGTPLEGRTVGRATADRARTRS